MASSDRPQQTRSRRERPAKPALSREGIIAAALAILRDEGLEKVTMRRLAAALDTGAASLYVYVRDTEDLHAQLLDALLGTVADATPTDGTWRERIIAALTSYARVLFEYPGIARITLFTQPSGPNYLALVDRLLGLLNGGASRIAMPPGRLTSCCNTRPPPPPNRACGIVRRASWPTSHRCPT